MNIENKEGKTPLSILANRDGYFLSGIDADAEHEENNVLLLELPIVINAMGHVRKLQVIGLYVSDKNENCYDDLLDEEYEKSNSNLLDKRAEHFDEDVFDPLCERAINQMREMKLDIYTTLLDIIFKEPHNTAWHVKNLKLQQIIASTDFKNEYPIKFMDFF